MIANLPLTDSGLRKLQAEQRKRFGLQVAGAATAVKVLVLAISCNPVIGEVTRAVKEIL